MAGAAEGGGRGRKVVRRVKSWESWIHVVLTSGVRRQGDEFTRSATGHAPHKD